MRSPVDLPFYHSETPSAVGRITWAGPYVNSPGQPLGTVNTYAFVYVTRGVCEYSDSTGKCCRLTPGDMVIRFPGFKQGYHPLPGQTWDERYIRCDGPLLEMWHKATLISTADPIWRLLPVKYWVERMIAVVGDTATPDHDEILAQMGRLQVFFADMRLAKRSSTGYPEDRRWLHMAKELLDPAVSHERSDLDEVAAAVGMDYHSFRRRFTRLADIAPTQYRLQAQIGYARALIMARGPTIGNKELADLCGFYDECHFSRQFKRITGMTPSQYRLHCSSQ